MTDPWIGRTLGRYQIEREIGRGGMGVVYQGRQLSLNRPVAVKVLVPQLAIDPAFAARFRQEAQVIASLVHENIVHVYDVDEADGATFIVMELVSGRSLRALAETRRFGAEEVRSIGVAVARALAAAHQQGIVHRDVKSQNVMVTRDGKVKLMDFGIARVAGAVLKTQTGSVLGTPEYMAPEQVRSGETSPRTDLYSLGVLLYEIATGRMPFAGGDPISVALKHVSEPVPAPREVDPSVPEWLARILLKALAKEPGQRYQSAVEIERDLLGGGSAAADGAAPGDRPGGRAVALAPAVTPTVPLAARTVSGATGQTYAAVGARKGLAVVAGAVLAILLVGAAWFLLAARSPASRGVVADGESPAVQGGGSAGAAAPAEPSTKSESASGPGLAAAPDPLPAAASKPPEPAVSSPVRPAPAEAWRARSSAGSPAPPVPGPAEARRTRPSTGSPSPPVPSPAAVPERAEAAALPPAQVEPAPSPAATAPPPPRPAFTPPAPVSKRFTCREEVEFQVEPEEAVISIDGERLGVADDWDGAGGGAAWKPAPGAYVACFTRPEFLTACVEVVIDRTARRRTCEVETELEDVD